MQTVTLKTPLAQVLGSKTAAALQRAFGYQTVADLLWHLPRRYTKRGELTALNTLPVGEHATIVAQVLDVQKRQMASRAGSILTVRVTDGTGYVSLTFFNQPWREQELLPGKQGQFSGKVTSYRGQLQLQNPDYQLFDSAAETREAGGDPEQLAQARAKAYALKPVPVYPATAAVPSWVLAKSIDTVLAQLETVADPLPLEIRAAQEIIDYDTALRLAHQPERDQDFRAALGSLKFREAFELQLALVARAAKYASRKATPRPLRDDGYVTQLDAGLPFSLTADQQAAGARLSAGIASTSPLATLLQGEVGAGKTLVALRAMLQVADSGGQSALLAPTEVLAAQHFENFQQLLPPAVREAVHPVLITGSMPQAERRKAALAVASGQALLVVGTHALLSEKTMFADLGFIVVDEQHRFGVEQREALRNKAKTVPHLLAMTATPIPRTVALTAFGELETVEIRQLPAGRAGITSFAVQTRLMPQQLTRAWQRAREEIAAGRQVYVVCPNITAEAAAEKVATETAAAVTAAAAGEGRNRASVHEVAARLRARPDFAGVRIGELTGQLGGEAKTAVMTAFAAGEIDLLVATTVVEVGVNVPNATMMLVLEADRFGVSQLHQLRGRVGRGQHPGLCLFLTEAEPESTAWSRLTAVAATLDGFALAEIDLEQRGEGDILGTAQAGVKSTLRLLRVTQDAEVLYAARAWAEKLVGVDPQLQRYPELQELLRVQEQRLAQLDKT